MDDFKKIQRQWAQWLRDPNKVAAPQQADSARLQVYNRLVRNNIENFIERGFPVLADVLEASQWQQLMQDFVQNHHATSPLFAQIGDEFVRFLEQRSPPSKSANNLPAFTVELARYERMEVDVFNAMDDCSVPELTAAPEQMLWQVNPSVQWRDFSYAVHTISRDNIPDSPLQQPIFIAVYRVDYVDQQQLFTSTVKFMQLNPVTTLLIDLLQQQSGLSISDMATQLAAQLPQFSQPQLEQGLLATIPDLYQRAMLFPIAN